MQTASEWILDSALDYAEAGFAVIPVRPDKTPYTQHGLKDASKDPDTIRKWWETWPDANVAIACGRVSGNIVVLDVDMKNGKNGKRSIEIWEAEHGDLPETVMANTPSGGKHYFFRVKDPSLYKNTVEALVGVDIRGDGAYVLVYPSGVGGDGKAYTWSHGVSITDQEEIADANASVLELLELNSRGAANRQQDAAKKQRTVVNVDAGNRNDTIFRYACSQCGLNVPIEVALDAALKLNETFNPPLDPHEVEKTVRSAYSYEPNEKTIYGDARPETDANGEFIPRLPAELTMDFLLNPPPKKPPIIMGFLREGEAMLLSGNPKAGKSFLIVQLALAVATGSKWIGVTCQKKPVLYIDGELSPEMTAERIRDIREHMGISYLPENLHVINTKNEEGVTLQDVADDFVHGIRKEEVVIIDPLYMFLRGSDENDNSQMKKEMEQIKRISATGTAVIVVHHMSKGIQSGKMSIDRASGAGVLGRFFDSILTLNLLNKEPTDHARPERVEADTRSFQQPRPVNLWFDGFHVVDGSGDLAGRDLNDPKKSTLEQKTANDVGKINHCYFWMKDNCVLREKGGFILPDMLKAYESEYGKLMKQSTLRDHLSKAGYVASNERIKDPDNPRQSYVVWYPESINETV